jgi:hypothetical protein
VAKQTVISGEWCDTESVMRALDVSQRTVQKWAEKGHLKFKTIRDGSRRIRLYDAGDVERLRESGPPRSKTERNPGNGEVAARKTPKAEAKLGHALETVSIVGQMIAGQKAELENRRAELSALVGQLADFVKSSQDAERQRRKDELTDARERWEAERKDARERFEWEKQKWELERKAQEAEREFAALERMRASLRQVDWLSPHECYVLKGLPGKAAKQFAEEGKLDGVRVGKSWRIRRASLEEFRG